MAMIEVRGVAVELTQDGTGPDLFLLHSLLTDITVFEQIVPRLRESHRVTCVNLPGFGASAPLLLDSVAAYADHVGHVMTALRLGSRTTVFGNGFGAFVALELAIRHGGSFDGLCVADVVAAFPEPAKAPFRAMAGKVRASGMTAVLDIAIGRMFPPTFQARFPDVVAMRKTQLARVNAECFARACHALADLDLRDRLSSIGNRTLVLCGALDQTTPPALARDVADAIPRAEYREIAESGHCPMLEQPDALVAALLEFGAGSSKAA